jgi:GAF domain-containing protein
MRRCRRRATVGDVSDGLGELYQVSQAVLSVNRQMSVRDVLQVIVRSARSLVGARYAALGVPDEGDSFAEFVVDGMSAEQWQAIGPLPRRHGMLAVLLNEGQPERLADIRVDPRFEGWPAAHPDMSHFLGVPVRDGDRVLGIIFAANKIPAAAASRGFTERDTEILSLFAAHAAIALTNARLYERSRELSVLQERSRLRTTRSRRSCSASGRTPAPRRCWPAGTRPTWPGSSPRSTWSARSARKRTRNCAR